MDKWRKFFLFCVIFILSSYKLLFGSDGGVASISVGGCFLSSKDGVSIGGAGEFNFPWKKDFLSVQYLSGTGAAISVTTIQESKELRLVYKVNVGSSALLFKTDYYLGVGGSVVEINNKQKIAFTNNYIDNKIVYFAFPFEFESRIHLDKLLFLSGQIFLNTNLKDNLSGYSLALGFDLQ